MELNKDLYIKGVSDYLENGLNFFNGTWESGSINNSGANISSDTSIRSSYVSIAPNTSYYFSSDTSSTVSELWANYYNNGTFVSREYLGVTNSKNFTTPAGANQVRFRLSFSDTVTANVISNVMLNKGSIQLPYEPYNGGYASKDYLENGKNLWNYNATNTIVGVTSTYNNSTLTLNGTSTGETSNISHTNMVYLKPGTYTFKIVKESGSATGSQAIFFKNYTTNTNILNTTLNLSSGNTITFTLQNSAWVSLAIYFFASNVFTNLKLDIQIEEGSSATPYEEYYGKYLNNADIINGILSNNQMWRFKSFSLSGATSYDLTFDSIEDLGQFSIVIINTITSSNSSTKIGFCRNFSSYSYSNIFQDHTGTDVITNVSRTAGNVLRITTSTTSSIFVGVTYMRIFRRELNYS